MSTISTLPQEELQTSVVEVTSDMFDVIYPLLNELNPKMPLATWKRLFDYEWGQEEQHKGYALVCNGQYVGFLGMIFSLKDINGQLEKFCNLACWYVQEPYRNNSLSLLLPVLGLKKHTIKNLTPTPTAHAIFSKLGFKELDKRLMILPIKLFPQRQNASIELLPLKNVAVAETILNAKDIKIFNDHQSYPGNHFVVKDNNTGQYCYVITNKVKKKLIDFAYVHYMSDKHMFWDNIPLIKWYLFKTFNTPLTLLDERHDVADRKAFCFYFTLKAPKLFRSTRVKREDIDHLYSELFLLQS